MSLNANLKAKKTDYRAAGGGGLYLLVRPNGSKLWRHDYGLTETDGIARRTLSIGEDAPDGDGVRSFTLKQARDEHESARSAVAPGPAPRQLRPPRGQGRSRSHRARASGGGRVAGDVAGICGAGNHTLSRRRFLSRKHRTCGMSWSRDIVVARDFAENWLWRTMLGGSVLLQATAPPNVIICEVSNADDTYGEQEVIVDRRYLQDVKVLERFCQLTPDQSQALQYTDPD